MPKGGKDWRAFMAGVASTAPSRWSVAIASAVSVVLRFLWGALIGAALIEKRAQKKLH